MALKKKEECNICNKMIQKTHLEIHLATHEGKVVHCPACNKKIVRSMPALMLHMSVEHPHYDFSEGDASQLLSKGIKQNGSNKGSIFTISGGAVGLGRNRKH